MNKTLSVLLCLATLLSLCACGNSESAEDTELIKLSSEANTMFKKSEEAAFSLNKDFVSDDGLIEISIHDAMPVMIFLRVRVNGNSGLLSITPFTISQIPTTHTMFRLYWT